MFNVIPVKEKRNLKGEHSTNEQLAVWEEGNLRARYWRQLINGMAAYAKSIQSN